MVSHHYRQLSLWPGIPHTNVLVQECRFGLVLGGAIAVTIAIEQQRCGRRTTIHLDNNCIRYRLVSVGRGQMAVGCHWRILIQNGSVQCHELFLRQLLDNGSRIAIAQHVVGGPNAVAVEFRMSYKIY